MTSKEPKSAPPPKDPQPGFFGFIFEHKWEIVSYVLLFIGLFLSFANQLLGGLLVGLVLGIYFSQEIYNKSGQFKQFIEREGIFSSFIIVAAVLALLILAPGLVVGTAIGAVVRPYLGTSISSPFDKDKTEK